MPRSWSGSVALCILNLGTRWRRVVIFILWLLYTRGGGGAELVCTW